MGRRTLENWQTIIDAQLASGLTIVKYCEQNQINPKTFSSRKAILKQKNKQPNTIEKSGFVQVKTDRKTSAGMIFETAHGTLKLSSDISPEWVGRLLKAISA